MLKHAPKIAPVVYMLWGVIYILGSAAMLNASAQGPGTFVQMLSGNANAALSESTARDSLGLLSTTEVFAFHSFAWIGPALFVLALFFSTFGRVKPSHT